MAVFEASDGELRVRSVEAVIDELQAWAAQGAPSGVDMLIEERRREARLEEEESGG